ncbi:MAG: histidine phosphatase family protein [Patescibacteria group bacterium]|jgi:broad specificity phosphatase PhoE
MSVKIIYFVHGTTTDNESGKSTGWADGELSELGVKQAKALKEQIAEKDFEVIFCSDLKGAIDSVSLGFKNEYPIIHDERLRECNYGDLTQHDEKLVDYNQHIDQPFPNGESLKDVEGRIRDFLSYLKNEYNNKFVAVLAHRAPQLALEVILNGKSWVEALKDDWRNRQAWQPGWIYEIKD